MTPFDETERRIFRAVVEAVVDRDAPDDVGAGIAPMLVRMSAADRRLLRLLLLGLEYAAPVGTRRAGRFSSLPRERRASWLERWADSRLELRRRGAASLKALAGVAFYGREASWDDVGYDGPWLGRVEVRVLAAPPLAAGPPQGARLRPGATSARALPTPTRVRARVCVIGTGAGGAAVLARLARAGVDVVAVEAGPLTTAADYDQRELHMLPRLYREAGLRATADKAVGILQGTGVGGSTLHNTGLVYPAPDGVLGRWRQEHGLPHPHESMRGYLAGAMEILHANGIPPTEINENNDALRRGAEALQLRYRVGLHNRASCSACGYCMIGCAYNRKHNASLTYVADAVRAGARVVTDAEAMSIVGPRGARRVRCRVLDASGRPTGEELDVEAQVVVVSAGAVDSPALLLRSGLGNARVGRGLRLHPSAMVLGIMPDEVRAWRGLPQSVLVEEYADFLDTGRGGFLFIPLGMVPGIAAATVPGLGARHRELMKLLPRLASTGVLVHDETEGRVAVGRDGRPVVRYWPGREDLDELRRGLRALGRLYLAAGAGRVVLPFTGAPEAGDEAELDDVVDRARLAPHRVALGSVHPQGSCPLDARRDRGAVDPHGELWGEHGVFVADTSVFPTSVGVPPQITTMALATATADYILAERL